MILSVSCSLVVLDFRKQIKKSSDYKSVFCALYGNRYSFFAALVSVHFITLAAPHQGIQVLFDKPLQIHLCT